MERFISQDVLDNKYTIKKLIDDSGAYGKVYLVESPEGYLYAAKVFSLIEDDSLIYYLNPRNEINFLSKIQHPHVIKYISDGIGPLKFNGKCYENKQYLIMEYAANLTLFDYSTRFQYGFPEDLTKILCWIIFSTVNNCHKQGIFVSDIKVENILVNDNFDVKLSDFGGAREIDPNDEVTKNLKGGVKTDAYAAPEMLKGENYNAIKAEIFSLGVVAFALLTGTYGFTKATENDKLYKYIIENKIDEYIEEISKIIPSFKNINREFLDLYFKMVSFNPSDRPSLDYILGEINWFEEMRNLEKNEGFELLVKKLKDELKVRLKDIYEILEEENLL